MVSVCPLRLCIINKKFNETALEWCRLLRNIDNRLRRAISPDSNDSQRKAQRRKTCSDKIPSRKTLNLGSHLLPIHVVQLLIARSLTLDITENLVAGLHARTGGRGGRLCR